MLIVGLILIISGFIHFYKNRLTKKFYQNIKNKKTNDYVKVTGTVVCCAYSTTSSSFHSRPTTPIVEYEVDGEIYEIQNSVLKTGNILPVGAKVYVWYKKNEPKQAILDTELDGYYSTEMFGVIMIFFGIIAILLSC